MNSSGYYKAIPLELPSLVGSEDIKIIESGDELVPIGYGSPEFEGRDWFWKANCNFWRCNIQQREYGIYSSFN